MSNEKQKYQIALKLLPGVGDITAKKLIAYCGSAEAVFSEKEKTLLKIPNVGEVLAKEILNHSVFERAEREIKFIEKNKIQTYFFTDKEYPNRLKYCEDSPIMLYCKGKFDFENPKIISIVGSRNATDYGKKICEKLIEELANHNVLIVSGLAYGIDICAHKTAVANNLQTIAVLAHGLDKLYPSNHKSTADLMQNNGGLVTEYLSETNPDKENFPNRNRIVAGLCDAAIVIEATAKSGALITAEYANNYNREVFAVPGRIGDIYSEGCNHFIKINKAVLIESAKDVAYLLGWENTKQIKKMQQQLFVDLKPDEEIIVNLLKEKTSLDIDNIGMYSKFPTNKVSSILLNLEFSGIVKALPGKVYRLNN